MGSKLTYHGLPNIKGSSFNFKLPYVIAKKPCQKQDSSVINAQLMLSQNVERRRVSSTLQWLKTTSKKQMIPEL